VEGKCILLPAKPAVAPESVVLQATIGAGDIKCRLWEQACDEINHYTCNEIGGPFHGQA
jgi:hypothetical protein